MAGELGRSLATRVRWGRSEQGVVEERLPLMLKILLAQTRQPAVV
jgi:hypothetical protein